MIREHGEVVAATKAEAEAKTLAAEIA